MAEDNELAEGVVDMADWPSRPICIASIVVTTPSLGRHSGSPQSCGQIH